MRNKSLSLLAAALFFLTTASANTYSSSDRIEAIMRLDQFSNINCDVIADLTLIQEDSSYIRVTAPKSVVENMEVLVNNETLSVSTKKLTFASDIKIVICSPSIISINNKGHGNVNIPGAIRENNFYLDNKGVGNININDIKCESLTVKSEGVGNVNISGKVKKAKYQINGVGDLNARRCVASDVEVISNGIGNTECYAGQSIKVFSNGIGNIRYWGKPNNKSISKTGVGNITAEE